MRAHGLHPAPGAFRLMLKPMKDQQNLQGGQAFWTADPPDRAMALNTPEGQQVMLDVLLRSLRGMRVQALPVELVSIQLRDANGFIDFIHRHSRPVPGWKFGMALRDAISLVGVAIVARPVARALDDASTLEVTRLCLLEGATPNLASQLLGSCRRSAKGMGYSKLISYTREQESGTCYRAAGWTPVSATAGGSWSCPSRPRDRHEDEEGPKTRWELTL